MIKKTQKYLKALEQLQDESFEHETADQIYDYLQSKGFYWDSTVGGWLAYDAGENNPASSTIKIRIWFDKDKVVEVANTICQNLERDGYRVIDKSKPYQCRPPEANDARVYLIVEKQG